MKSVKNNSRKTAYKGNYKNRQLYGTDTGLWENFTERFIWLLYSTTCKMGGCAVFWFKLQVGDKKDKGRWDNKKERGDRRRDRWIYDWEKRALWTCGEIS